LGAQLEPLAIIENIYLEKASFRPSKWPQNLKTDKNGKFSKLLEKCFEQVGKGGWPLISTWITLILAEFFFATILPCLINATTLGYSNL
jgi:hypothetical protein